MSKKHEGGPSKSRLLKDHAALFKKHRLGQATDQELSDDSRVLQEQGIPFADIVVVREKAIRELGKEKNRGGKERVRT
ncbi:MAG: hypothetical protein PHW75_02745 [Patescibacteria group bacterium]|nr:hypothetical protein [Patescibacteria group bacterium]